MALLKRYLRLELEDAAQEQHPLPRDRPLRRSSPSDIQDELADAIERTSNNTGLLFNIALNYGGRAEIVDAARRLIAAGHRARRASTSAGSASSSTPPASPIRTC